MPDGPNPGQSYESWIESMAGASPPSQTQQFIREMAARGRGDWPFPPKPPYEADDEDEATPDE